MHCVIFYDITSNRIRRKIADVCQDYGMDRTQFSAFVGDIVRSQQRELMLKLKNLLGDADGALLLIPVSAEQWDQRVEVRQNAPGETHPSSIADREMPDGSLY